MPYPEALLWIDAETTDLPEGNDYSKVYMLEIAAIVTDFDLNKITGYHTPIKLTPEAADSLRENDYVRNMHKANGLIKDAAQSDVTVSDAEVEIIKMLKEETALNKGNLMIAGSGVAAFDHPLLKHWMPELASWLAYYPFDIGIERRVSKILAGRPLVNPTTASYGEDKLHRALNDVEAHIEETRTFRDFYRSLK